jgi:uncharacterized repeat protein (TIGR01451 family)
MKSIGGCARLGGNQQDSVICTMPSLAPGASESATFGLLASSVGVAELRFGAAGLLPLPIAGEFEGVGDEVTLPVTVQPGATDVQVTGSSNNGSPAIGSPFDYTFQVKNDGPLPAAGVIFEDPLPAAILLGSPFTIDNGACSADVLSNGLQCSIGALAVGQQSDITLPAAATMAGVFANTATVTMIGADTHPANNSFTVTVQPR